MQVAIDSVLASIAVMGLIGFTLFSFLLVNNAYGHAVCAARSCEPCAPLRIITNCGQVPDEYEQAAFALLIFGAVGFGIFAILKNRARKLTC